MQNLLNQILTGVSYNRSYAISGISFPRPSFGTNFVLVAGLNAAILREVTLDTPGFIYGDVVFRSSKDDPIPTVYQIMQGLTNDNKNASGKRVNFTSTAVSIDISGLSPSNPYYLYFLAQSQDMSEMVTTTMPIQIGFTTQTAIREYARKLECLGVIGSLMFLIGMLIL